MLTPAPVLRKGRGLRREWNGSRSGKRGGEAGEHDEVGVERDPLQAAHAERSEAVVVLQAPELALDGGAATVEIAPPLRLARNERVLAVGPDLLRLRLTLAGGAAPLGCLALEVGPRERPGAVVAGGSATGSR